MDACKTAREIGLFETAGNLAPFLGSTEIAQRVGACMPMPDADIGARTAAAAGWLRGFGKAQYLFLTPEIALVEAMAALPGPPAKYLLAVPCDMDPDARTRLENNLPKGANAAILEEPFFPEAFYPGNSMLVVCGYTGGDRPMVLPDTYRMTEHYSGFLGKKVFVPYAELDTAARYDGWIEADQRNFTLKWRMEK